MLQFRGRVCLLIAMLRTADFLVLTVVVYQSVYKMFLVMLCVCLNDVMMHMITVIDYYQLMEKCTILKFFLY